MRKNAGFSLTDFPQTVFGVFIILSAIAFLAGCGLGTDRTLRLPETPILSGAQGWAVVTGAYARFKEKNDPASPDTATARRGEVFRVIGSERDPSGGDPTAMWYRLSEGSRSGWLRESDILFFKNREQALTASAGMK